MRIEESRGQGQSGQSAATAEQVLGEIRDYCRETRTAESTFGRLAVNDGKLVARLKDGRQITMAKAEALKAWMRNDRVQHSKEAA